nr:hypothetical protein [Tanacetum cinerariifolium]
MLHMDLFGPTFVKSLNNKMYCLVVTNDFSRALVTKSHNKTPYELLNGRTPRLDFMRPFGYPITILNTLYPLGKFKGKADEGFLVRYSVTSKAFKEVSDQHYIVLPLWSSNSSTFKSSDDKATDDKPKDDTGSNTIEEPVNKEDQAYRDELDRLMCQEKEASDAADSLRKEFELGYMDQRGATKAGSTNSFNIVSNPVNAAKADFNNMNSSTVVSLIPTHRVHINHPKDQIPRDPKSEVQIKGMAKKNSGAHAYIAQALDDESWVEAMQEELLQFSLQKVWRLVDMPYREKAIGTKWVYRNKKDERDILIEAIRIFLAFASFMGFIIYQMDVKSTFLYGTIEEEVYVSQPPGFIDPHFPNKVYKVEKALYGLHQAPRAWFQVTPKLSHLHVVKPIFRYIKGQPKLGIWYPRDSSFDLEAYSDSDYARANLDRKSITGEYVAAATCCGQVFDLDIVKTGQEKEITSLKKRVTKMEQRQSLRFLGFHPFRAGTSKRYSFGRRKVSKQGRKNLKSQQMFTAETVSTARPDISAARQEVSIAEPKTPPTTTTTLFDDEDVTIVDNLVKMKNYKAKEKGISFKDADDSARLIRSITTLQPLPTIDPKDKDEEAKTEIGRQEDASKAALVEMYDEVQAQIGADHELAIRLTHGEQEKYTVEERSKLLAEVGFEEDKKRIRSRNKRVAGLSSKHKSPKKQKVNDQESEDSEKEHRKCLKVVPVDDKAIDYETLDVKSLIVDCEMLDVIDRQDVVDLHKIIMERFPTNDPEGYDLILWGDQKTLVESSEDDKIWKNQQDWKLLS